MSAIAERSYWYAERGTVFSPDLLGRFAALGGYLMPLLVYGLAGLLLAYALLRREVVD